MNPVKEVKARSVSTAKPKVTHSVVVTAAHIHDVTLLPDRLPGDKTRMWGDLAYLTVGKRGSERRRRRP